MVDKVQSLQFGATPSPLDLVHGTVGELKQPKANTKTGKSGLPVPEYNTDTLGAGTDTPENPVIQRSDTPASAAKAFFSGVGYTGREYYASGRENFLYDVDTEFDPKAGYDKFVATHGLFTTKEMNRLLTAPSEAAQQDRISYILDERDRMKAIGDHQFVGTVGTVLDIDLPVAFAGGVIGVGAKAAGAARATQRVVSAASATGIMGGVIAGTAGGTQLSTLDHSINLVAAGIGGAFALTKPRPTTTPSPSTTARGADTATPSPLPVDSTTITRSAVDTPEEAVPTKVEIPVDVHLDNIAEELQEAQGIIDRIRSGEESNNLAYGEKLDAIQARYAKVDTDKTITPANTLTGTIVGTHGSKVDNLEFKNNFDREANIESVGYHDNVFGDDVVYLGEVGDSTVSWSPRNPEEAADMRMPYYENEYTVQTTFKKAFVLDPDSAKGLSNALGDGSKNGIAVVKYLRSQGYDGLIVRDMGAMSKPVDHTKVDNLSYYSGLDNELLQEQVIAFNPESVKVVGKSSDVNPQELQRTLTDSGVYGSVPKSIDTKGTTPNTTARGVDTATPSPLPVDSSTITRSAVDTPKSVVGASTPPVTSAPLTQAQQVTQVFNVLAASFSDAATKNVAGKIAQGADVRYYKPEAIRAAERNPNYNTVRNTDGSISVVGVRTSDGKWAGIGKAQTAPPSTPQIKPVTRPPTTQSIGTTQTLDDMIEEEITSVSKPTPDTAASIDLGGGAKVNLKIANDSDMQEKLNNSLALKSEILAEGQSAADQMFYYMKGDLSDPMSRLLTSAVYTLGEDVGSLAHASRSEGEWLLQRTETLTEKATKLLHGTSGILGRIVGKQHTKNQRDVFMDVYEGMQRVDQEVLARIADGKTVVDADIIKLIDGSDKLEPIKEVMREYVGSGFAVNRYDMMKSKGLLDDPALAGLPRRSTYMPLKHDYIRMNQLISAAGKEAKAGRKTAVSKFIGEQIQKTYPSLSRGITRLDGTVVRLDTEALGDKFIANLKERANNPNTVSTTGIPKNDLHDIMTAHGIPVEEASQLVDKIASKQASRQGMSNLKSRIKWDWNKTGTFPDGTTFGMRDIVGEHQFSKLVDYNRTTSHRAALAHYGFKSKTELLAGKARILDDLPKGVNPDKAARFIDEVIDMAMGNPVGQALPDLVRSANTMASMMLLAWSGVYTAVEAAVQVVQIGFLRTVPHLIPSIKPMIKGMKGYTKDQAKGMKDMLTGMGMNEGRWKDIFTHHSDDFDVGNSFHEGVQYVGQSTRFLNGAEVIKRWQIGVYAGVITRTFEGAAKGSAKDIKFLKESARMSDELIDAVSAEIRVHGDNVNAWDADVRGAMQQKVLHEMSNHAISFNIGELPAFIGQTSWGKMVLPFMSFVWAAHNRLLRRTYVRDGALAVAMVLAVQFPLAMVVSNLKLAAKGEEPYDLDTTEGKKAFVQSLLSTVSGLGVFSLPLDALLTDGKNLGSVAAFAPIGKTMALANAVMSEDGASVRDVKENSVLNPILGLTAVMALFGEEDE